MSQTQASDDILSDLFSDQSPQRLVTCTVESATADAARVVTADGVHAVLPASEWPPTAAWLKPGDRAVVVTAQSGDVPLVSGRHSAIPMLLLESLVPEMWDGQVRVMGVARAAGYRAKLAVAATVDGVDAIAVCVGRRAARVQRVSDLLGGERVDIVAWHSDPAVYVANALAPTTVLDVTVEPGRATVVVPDHQVATAVGAGGQNSQLASRLTGLTITVVGQQ